MTLRGSKFLQLNGYITFENVSDTKNQISNIEIKPNKK